MDVLISTFHVKKKVSYRAEFVPQMVKIQQGQILSMVFKSGQPLFFLVPILNGALKLNIVLQLIAF